MFRISYYCLSKKFCPFCIVLYSTKNRSRLLGHTVYVYAISYSDFGNGADLEKKTIVAAAPGRSNRLCEMCGSLTPNKCGSGSVGYTHLLPVLFLIILNWFV